MAKADQAAAIGGRHATLTPAQRQEVGSEMRCCAATWAVIGCCRPPHVQSAGRKCCEHMPQAPISRVTTVPMSGDFVEVPRSVVWLQ